LMACVEQSKALSCKAKPIVFLFNATKTPISLQLFNPTSIALQLNFLITKTILLTLST
jgi:hypothetical protein